MNQKQKQIIKILLLFLFCCTANSQRSSTTEYRQKYCSEGYINFDKSLKKYEDERDRVDNEFYNNYMDIIDALQGKSTVQNLFQSFTVAAIFLLIFLIVSLVSIVVFFIFCCGKCRKQQNYKPYLAIALLFFVFMIVLFILILIYVGLSQKYVNDFLCSTFKIPSVLIDGANDNEIQFAGLETYRKTFSNFKSEQNNLGTSLVDFQVITQQNLNQKSQNLLTQTQDFITQTQSIKVPNMSAKDQSPNSASQMNIGINVEISSQISQVSKLGAKMTAAAETGQLFVLAPLRTLVDAALVQIDGNLERIITKMEMLLEPITKDMDTAKKYILAAIWILFAFFILIMILLTWVVVIATCYNKNGKCANQLQCGRTILVILSFLTFLLGILLFILATGSVSLSGACGFIFELNRDKVELLYKFDNLNQDAIKAAEICLFRNSTGDMTELASSEIDVIDQQSKRYLMQIYEVLDGFTAYRLWYNSQENQQLESQEMLDFEVQLDNIGIQGSGNNYDFYDVEDTLQEFNDQISCSEEIYQLKNSNCENQTNCKIIDNSSTFQAPTCSNDAQKVAEMFATLKNYTVKENSYIDDTTNRMVSLSLPQSPNNAYREMILGLNSINGASQNIENKLSGTLQPIIETGYSWMQIEDCRQLRKLMIEFEIITCHRLNHNVYIFFVVVFIASYFLLLILWMLFCLLRKKNSDKVKVAEPYYNNDIAEIKELEDERIPMA